MDAERVLNRCSLVASSIVTLSSSLYHRYDFGLFYNLFKSAAKIQLFFELSKFLSLKKVTFLHFSTLSGLLDKLP